MTLTSLSEVEGFHMILKNQTTNKIICKDLKFCESFIDRMFGLLLPKNSRNLLFKTRFGIHTFFLKEPIDLLILDNKMQIVKIKKDLQPNSLFFWNPKFDHILELKSGTISKQKIKVNQLVVIK